MDIELIRNGNIELASDTDNEGKPEIHMSVEGKYDVSFGPKSNMVDQLRSMDIGELEEQINGGTFFFVEGQLVDWQGGRSGKFVHSDEAVQSLAETVGYSYATNGAIKLKKQWSDHNIQVPGYDEGGEFTSKLSYVWSPFSKNIQSSFDLVRLICENGMTARTRYLNSQIPMLNRWEEHLNIASRQIQNKVESKVTNRLAEMGQERASVGDLMLLLRHATDRMEKVASAEQRERAARIIEVVDPQKHLNGTYKERVFENDTVAQMVPGHLTTFDAYNIATELNSHFEDTKNSSTTALDKYSTELVFHHKDRTSGASKFDAPVEAPFSDPETAFFGELETA